MKYLVKCNRHDGFTGIHRSGRFWSNTGIVIEESEITQAMREETMLDITPVEDEEKVKADIALVKKAMAFKEGDKFILLNEFTRSSIKANYGNNASITGVVRSYDETMPGKVHIRWDEPKLKDNDCFISPSDIRKLRK